jgi:adenosylcobinamide kinase/adenosylcobinamide-phosphate guanylyltransferase
VLIDCLTLWLSNLMHREQNVDNAIRDLVDVLSRPLPGALFLVSNEVGLGLVPETTLGRRFRDHQGRLNQAVARVSDRVEFIAAGLPLTLK